MFLLIKDQITHTITKNTIRLFNKDKMIIIKIIIENFKKIKNIKFHIVIQHQPSITIFDHHPRQYPYRQNRKSFSVQPLPSTPPP